MQVRYDEDLIVALVFICMSGRRAGVPHAQISRFQWQRDRLYSIIDPDDRSAAFFRLNLDWFREWELEQALTGLLGEFPAMRANLATLVFRRAQGRNDEGAELYVNGDSSRNAVLALRPERFIGVSTDAASGTLASDRELRAFLRHEFTHLDDMLAPAFGYLPVYRQPGMNAAQERLTRERYRLLWDITIDGRIHRSRHPAPSTREQHRAAFDRAFGFWPDERRDVTFERLWTHAEPRHADLLTLASDPREIRDSHEPQPGGACPLCGFATFEWAQAGELSADVLSIISREFVNWTPDRGICHRCIEIYRVLATQSAVVL